MIIRNICIYSYIYNVYIYTCFSKACGKAHMYLGSPFYCNGGMCWVDHGKGCEHIYVISRSIIGVCIYIT